jgi:predicted RecB family nuclease
VSESTITGTQARASEATAALDRVAVALSEAAAVVADLNAALNQDRRQSRSPVSSYVDFEPDLGFADWRCEVLSLLEAR